MNKKFENNLTSRQREIIEIIIQFNKSNPVTTSAISQKLGVSSRTILREIPNIEKWMDENAFNFIKKQGVGLIIDESDENKELILELLEVEKIKKIYSKDERRKLILLKLLSAEDYIKSYYFTNEFKISDGTLSLDLDSLEGVLSKYKVTLERKQGLGVIIKGEETSLRQIIRDVLYEFINEETIVYLLKASKDKALSNEVKSIKVILNQNLYSFLLDEERIKIEDSLKSLKDEFDFEYSNDGYINIVIYICIMLKRIKDKKNILKYDYDEDVKISNDYHIANALIKKLEVIFAFRASEYEILYITKYIKSSRIYKNFTNELDVSTLNTRQLTISFISLVSKELNISFFDDGSLVKDLYNHINQLLVRLKVNIRIKNDYVKNIRESYYRFYEATTVASELIKEKVGISEISESEIAFLTMHFCAAYERLKSNNKKINVVVVCPIGIATSRMLASNLIKTFSNLCIKEITSITVLDKEFLLKEGIDIVISTVKIDLDFMVVCVNPILHEQDKILLKDKFESLETKKRTNITTNEKDNLKKDDIKYISTLGDIILKIIEKTILFRVEKIDNKEELIKIASSIFSTESESKQKIKEDLLKRELISTSFVSGLNMIILHCKTTGVTECKFGYIRILKPKYINNNFIVGAIVMLIPNSQNEVYIDVMSQISASIIENQKLYSALKDKHITSIKIELENSLKSFYKEKIKKIIGDD